MSIRKRGARSYQVRVDPFPAQTVPTKDAAERLELDLKLRKIGGSASPEPATTLGQEIDGYLARLRAAGGLRPRSIEFYEQKAKVWKPLRGVRVSALRRVQVEDFIVKRASEHPRSALDELQFLKRVLGEARDRGQRVDDALFGIKPIKHAARRGRALGVEELYELASWFPEHVSRLVLLGGLVGARQAYWFQMTDEMLDLDGGTMTVPAGLAKNGREDRIYLTLTELTLLREQLLARPAATVLMFPAAAGRQWDRSRFGEVWREGVKAAADHDRERTGRPSSVYHEFNFHLLRHTAGSLMAQSGMDPAAAAERLGHGDGGALFLRTYRHLYDGEKRTQAARFDAHVRASLDKEGTSAPGNSQEQLKQAVSGDGRTWDRTRDLSRVKRALSR